MALCQAELGLRAGEVAALRLNGLDWRSAILRVPAGKVGRERELPLAARAGRAIADYLRNGWPPPPGTSSSATGRCAGRP